MQWLISQMWILLAVAGLLGLILGMALRGLMSGGKMRRATVERDVARTELGQARAEIDALYASQRKMKEEGTVSVDTSELDRLSAELANRDTQIADLQVSLQSARDDLEAARSEAKSDNGNTLQTAGAAVAGAAAGALLGGGDDDKVKDLEERNTWLEERVAALESDLEAAALAAQASEPIETAEDPTETVQSAESATEPEQTGPSLAKLEWQNTYLRQRVEALEGQMHVAPIPAFETATEPEAVIEETPQVDAKAIAENEEELARLRWRNRYLEGRLAYYEEGASAAASAETEIASEPLAETEDDTEQEDEDNSGVIAASVVGAGALAAAVLSGDDTSEEVEESTEDKDEDAVDLETDAADGSEVEIAQEADPEPEVGDAAEAGPDTEVETDLETETSISDSSGEEAAELEATVPEEVDELPTPELSDEKVAETSEEEPEAEHPSDAVLRSLDDTEETIASSDADTTEVDEDETTEDTSDQSAEIVTVQPDALPVPKDGGDDLTKIGGIGPRIAEVLNGLGVWTHAQIASWTPQNAAWIEEHLSFHGRVSREQWIEQAKVLIEVESASSD